MKRGVVAVVVGIVALLIGMLAGASWGRTTEDAALAARPTPTARTVVRTHTIIKKVPVVHTVIKRVPVIQTVITRVRVPVYHTIIKKVLVAAPTVTPLPAPTDTPLPTDTALPTASPRPAHLTGCDPDTGGCVTTGAFVAMPADEYLKPKAGYIFASVHLKMTNRGATQLDYNPLDFYLQGDDKVMYQGGVFAPSLAQGLHYGSLYPGQAVAGDVPFEIPGNGQNYILWWRPNSFKPDIPVPWSKK